MEDISKAFKQLENSVLDACHVFSKLGELLKPLKIINHSPSKEIKRVFKKTLKRCKKEHKKAKDYEECSYCLWNKYCSYGKKSREVNVNES